MNRLLTYVMLLGVTFLTARTGVADYKQAVVYYNQGRYDKAIQELKADLDQNPDWESGHRMVGLCYLNLQNNALAIASLTRAVQLKSTAFSTYLGLGQAYFNMQKFDNCVQTLNTGEQFAASKDPKEQESNLYRLHHLRGSANYRLGKFDEAVNDLTAALRISQGLWTDFSELGISYLNLKRYDEAIQALGKALAMKPDQKLLSEFLGKAYFRKGVGELSAKQYAQAIDSLQKAAEQVPRDGYVLYNLAEAHLFRKNYAEAERTLNRALEVMPQNADIYSRLGLVYEKQKKWDPALKAYRKAEELSPSAGTKEAIKRVTELKQH